MEEVDLIRVPSNYVVNKVREAGYFQSPAFSDDLPVVLFRDIKEAILDKLY